MSNPPQNFVPESQRERWIKYGANVALVSVIVVVLAGLVVYLAQKNDHRIDTTAAGLYSLKPQTINLIKDNKQKIKLVSLYVPQDKNRRPDDRSPQPIDAATTVRDLLQEYASKGKNIEYQAIDPVTQPTDALLKEAIQKYGGAVANYRKFLDEFEATFKQLKELTNAEAAAVASMKADELGDADEVISTIRESIPEYLSQMKERLDRSTRVQFPDYKAIVDRLKGTDSALDRANLDTISQLEDQLSKLAGQLKESSKVPEPVRKYLADSAPRHEAIKKLADETMKKIDGLGELKVGDLQQALKEANLILVLGETDWRVINPSQVWKSDLADAKAFAEGQEIKPRFAGEQAITTAILGLTSGTKPKVAFVRPGGRPLCNPGFPPFQAGGPFSEVADRLRDYNFDVLEKDLSGMWAMQAQMSGQPAQPEPSDEEIKDAVWIVLDIPNQERMGPSPASIGPKVAEHLKNGGSAMILALPDSDRMTDVLNDYGVELVTDATIVHEPLPPDVAHSSDFSEDVQRQVYVFAVHKYGDHPLAAPLRSLDSVVARAVPVKLTPVNGVKQTPLLPMPDSMKIWGERDKQSVDNGTPKFDESGANADIAPPLYAGAVVEKDKSRLIVTGNLVGFTNMVLDLPDQEMLVNRRVYVRRFPGNGELFTNSVFWLARMEPMIAISPAAMEVSRIADMGDAALFFWRAGVLLIVLPGLVLAAGIWMYFARRD